MSKERATTLDIAEAAGVTTGTVSRALSGNPLVKPKTRQRILEIAQRLNYHPNLSARALRTGRSGTLALACSTGPWVLHHPYFAQISSGFIAAAAEEGVRVTVYVPPSLEPAPAQVSVTQQAWPEEMHNGLADGCAIYQSHRLSKESMEYLRDSQLAVVLMNTDLEVPGFSQLLSHSDQRIRESLVWAGECGAKRIGILGLAERMYSANGGLRKGAEAAPQGVTALFDVVRHYDSDQPEAVDAALAALLDQRPDALVFNSTAHVFHFLKGQAAGRWPKDLLLFHHKPETALWKLPPVRYMVADLLGAGRLGYNLVKQSRAGGAPRSEGILWKREE